MATAKFIVFEGGEGSGKSTAAASVVEKLRANGLTVVHTREPGGTTAGELVRGLLHEPLTPWAELFAFLVARAQLVAEVIRPALERGETVVCDRFAPSTFAYQVHARGLDAECCARCEHRGYGRAGAGPRRYCWISTPKLV